MQEVTDTGVYSIHDHDVLSGLSLLLPTSGQRLVLQLVVMGRPPAERVPQNRPQELQKSLERFDAEQRTPLHRSCWAWSCNHICMLNSTPNGGARLK